MEWAQLHRYINFKSDRGIAPGETVIIDTFTGREKRQKPDLYVHPNCRCILTPKLKDNLRESTSAVAHGKLNEDDGTYSLFNRYVKDLVNLKDLTPYLSFLSDFQKGKAFPIERTSKSYCSFFAEEVTFIHFYSPKHNTLAIPSTFIEWV